MGIIINEFLNGENSICREERQFSLYLYNLLANCKRIKLDLENFANKNYEVAYAYYEASFMRDYFNDAVSKSEFNLRLLEFANRKLKEFYSNYEAMGITMETVDIKKVQPDEVYDINMEIDAACPDFDTAKHINGWSGMEKKYRNPLAKWMMNVKPDIALLLKRRGIKRDEYRLHFIECKYTSGLDSYPALVGVKDKNGKVTECRRLIGSQLQIQEMILEFLCKQMELTVRGDIHDSGKTGEAAEKSVSVENGFVSLAQFCGARNAANQAEVSCGDEKRIPIQKLCEYGINVLSEDRKAKDPKVILGSFVEVGF